MTKKDAPPAVADTVTQDGNSAQLVEGRWQSDNASFALWLNQVASDLEAAKSYGCKVKAAK